MYKTLITITIEHDEEKDYQSILNQLHQLLVLNKSTGRIGNFDIDYSTEESEV